MIIISFMGGDSNVLSFPVCAILWMLFLFKNIHSIYLKFKKTERQYNTREDGKSEMLLDEARCPELYPDVLLGKQGPSQLGDNLLSARIHFSRRLESGSELGLKPQKCQFMSNPRVTLTPMSKAHFTYPWWRKNNLNTMKFKSVNHSQNIYTRKTNCNW